LPNHLSTIRRLSQRTGKSSRCSLFLLVFHWVNFIALWVLAKFTYEATGTVTVPTKMRVALTGNALLQFQPKLLSYFRSDDLTSLALSNELTRVDLLLTEISRLTSLETLRLQRLLLNENSPRYINRLTKLNSLILDECQIEPAVFEKLLPVTKVQTLVFDGGPKISPQLKVIAKNRHLTSLTITSAVLSKDDLETLASISSLETLCLKYCSLTNDDLKVLTALSNLRDLDISFTKVDKTVSSRWLSFESLEDLLFQGYRLPMRSDCRVLFPIFACLSDLSRDKS
jgi:hypothetical protein